MNSYLVYFRALFGFAFVFILFRFLVMLLKHYYYLNNFSSQTTLDFRVAYKFSIMFVHSEYTIFLSVHHSSLKTTNNLHLLLTTFTTCKWWWSTLYYIAVIWSPQFSWFHLMYKRKISVDSKHLSIPLFKSILKLFIKYIKKTYKICKKYLLQYEKNK